MPESVPQSPLASSSERPRTFAQPVVTEILPVLDAVGRDPFLDSSCGFPRPVATATRPRAAHSLLRARALARRPATARR